MNVRKYIVKDMQEGFDRIRRELGGDAVILNQRTIREKGIAGWFKRPSLEIYAAWDDARSAVGSTGTVGYELRRPRPAEERIVFEGTPAFRMLQERLAVHDVASEVAALMVAEAARITERGLDRPLDALRRVITDRIGTRAEIPISRDRQTRILIAGPAGVGKTTTTLKLAAHFQARLARVGPDALAERTGSIGLVSADFSRAGAHDQLSRLGHLLEMPVFCIQSTRDAEQAFRQLTGCPVILIDTPGCNPSDPAQKRLLADLIREFRPDEICLCLSAPTSVSCSRRIFEQFSFIGDFRLILTKTDELVDAGAILNHSVLSRRTINGLTDSADFLRPLRMADGAILADQILE